MLIIRHQPIRSLTLTPNTSSLLNVPTVIDYSYSKRNVVMIYASEHTTVLIIKHYPIRSLYPQFTINTQWPNSKVYYTSHTAYQHMTATREILLSPRSTGSSIEVQLEYLSI